MNDVIQFMRDAGVFYVATVDGDKPALRPFSFFMFFEGRLYFGTRPITAAYQQLQINPNIEIVTVGADYRWLRISGTVHFDQRPEVVAAAIKVKPDLAFGGTRGSSYVPHFFYVENGTATINTLPAKHEVFTL